MRSYQQFCPAARALDVIGERWTLLVIRELLSGPKRYTDLQAGLPGVGPNVLAARLRGLEDAGVVEKKRLPPPAASTVYVLTERGEGLRPILQGLFEWGLQLLDSPRRHDALKASYWLPAVQAAAQAQALPDHVDDVYELRIGDGSLAVTARRGQMQAGPGPAESPDVVITTDHETFAKLGQGRVSALEAIESGRLSVEGDQAAAERCALLLGVAAADGGAAVSPSAGGGSGGG